MDDELTLRDGFALAAMLSLCMSPNLMIKPEPTSLQEIATAAYALADAMLKERN